MDRHPSPQARHPLPPGRHLPPEMATESGGTHPTRIHSNSFCPRGGGWLPSMYHWSHNRGGVCLWGLWGQTPRDAWDTTGYGQQAGGMHPTGMHSCLYVSSKSGEKYKEAEQAANLPHH